MKIQILFVYLILVLLLTTFENCRYSSTQNSPIQNKSVENGTPLNFDNSGGQPYDGKPFYNSDEQCSDGTIISSRILLNNDKAFLVRNHCKDIQPELISNDNFKVNTLAASNNINFNGVTYQKELGPLQIPLLTPFYTQLTGTLNFNTGAKVYIVDLFETSIETIAFLKSKNISVVCNFSAGTVETWNADYSEFPSESIGNPINSSSEKYIDIRNTQVRLIMLKRLDLARAKGCLGVDMDNMDGYGNKTGFPITPQLQIEYNSILAYAAHDRRLFAGFHNAAEIVPTLVNSYDFAYVEECFSYNECESYKAFTDNNKPTFVTEYKSLSSPLCQLAETLGISLSSHDPKLDGSFYESCSF